MNEETLKIQNMLLMWLACQKNPIKHDRIRDICNSCVFSVTGEKGTHSLYRYFYPLARAGFVECGVENRRTIWQLSKPIAFYRDFDCDRNWIGINLTETQKDLIASRFSIIEDESSSNFEQHSNVVRWTSSKEYDGVGLPIIQNPSATTLLKCLPSCSPSIFAEEEVSDICGYKEVFSWRKNGWEPANLGQLLHDGLYRESKQIYCRRIYYRGGKTYSLGNDVDDSFWAKIQHYIDRQATVAEYDANLQCIKFNVDPPFILSRILFLNQMFEKFLINSKRYYNVTKIQITELQRIICGKINQGGNDHD